MHIRHSTQLKLSAKFIKRCELRAYRYWACICCLCAHQAHPH